MSITWGRWSASGSKRFIAQTSYACPAGSSIIRSPNALYPGALGAVKHVQQWGTAVILSDGDAVFQPRKVEQSGLWRAFDTRVLIYVHKEQELDDVERFYPADHYVLIDDKLRILAAVKKIWGERVTTVFPKQGHYAHDPRFWPQCPPADIELANDWGSNHLRSVFTIVAMTIASLRPPACPRRAHLRGAAYMKVFVVVPPIGQPMNQRWISHEKRK